MKVVLAALPAFGHVYPLVPLALALEAAGAEVLLATGDGFEGRLPVRWVRGAPAGWSMRDAIHAVLADPEVAGRAPLPAAEMAPLLFGDACATAVLEPMVELLQAERPDLVIHEQTCVAAALAARTVGCWSVVCGIVGWGARWDDVYEIVTARFGERVAAGGGRAPHSVGDLADLFLDTHPSFLSERIEGLPFDRVAMRPEAWSEDGPVPAWLLGPRDAPRVYVTLGTVFASVEVLRNVAAAAASLGCEVLVATGPLVEPEALGELPASVHVERFVPQTAVLPLVDVVMHHGGTGTVVGALAHGLPQVVMPQGADQHWNAEHLAAQGACVVLGSEPAVDELAAALAAVLPHDAPHRSAAARLGAEVAALPSVESVAAQLVARFGAGRRLEKVPG